MSIRGQGATNGCYAAQRGSRRASVRQQRTTGTSVNSIRTIFYFAALAASLGTSAAELRIPPHAVIGVQAEQLSPAFWVARLAEPDKEILSAPSIAARNDRLLHGDASMHDLQALPAVLTRETVTPWITALS